MNKTITITPVLFPVSLCKCIVPVLIGLARSMGRFAYTDPPLLCRIFPRPKAPLTISNAEMRLTSDRKHHSFSNFRPIIPRSLSGNLNPHPAIDTTPSLITADHEYYLPAKRPSLQSYSSVPYDPATYFFSRYGSSFNQFPQMRCNESPERRAGMQFNVVHLQSVLALAKKLLTKEILTFLDEEAQQVCHITLQYSFSLCACIYFNNFVLSRCTTLDRCKYFLTVRSTRR